MNDAAKEFFDNLESEEDTEPSFDIFTEPEAKPEPTKEPEPTVEEPEDEPKKPPRSERRAEKQREYYEQQLQEERDARIRLEEQVKLISQGKQTEVDPDIRKLLTEVKDPEEASQVFESLLSKVRREAEDAAYNRLQQAQNQGDEEVQAIRTQIEDSIEAIEDRYGVDLTNDTATRNAYLDFVDSIAPKDSDALPNMEAAWKLFQSTRKVSTSNVERKQQIASRGMVHSTNAKPEAKDVQPIGFDRLHGDLWDRIIGKH